MSILRSRVEAAERDGVLTLPVPVDQLRALYDTMDKLDEIARQAYYAGVDADPDFID